MNVRLGLDVGVEKMLLDVPSTLTRTTMTSLGLEVVIVSEHELLELLQWRFEPDPSSWGLLAVLVKVAASTIGAFIVALVGLLEPEYDPEPDPDHDVNVYPLLADAAMATPVPESYQPVSPEMVGLVDVDAEPLPDGETAKVSWYCVAGLKLTVCAAVIVTDEVVTVPVVATFVLLPPSTFHEATLVPTPDARPQIPLDDTVRESPYLYQPSEVSDVRE